MENQEKLLNLEAILGELVTLVTATRAQVEFYQELGIEGLSVTLPAITLPAIAVSAPINPAKPTVANPSNVVVASSNAKTKVAGSNTTPDRKAAPSNQKLAHQLEHKLDVDKVDVDKVDKLNIDKVDKKNLGYPVDTSNQVDANDKLVARHQNQIEPGHREQGQTLMNAGNTVHSIDKSNVDMVKKASLSTSSSKGASGVKEDVRPTESNVKSVSAPKLAAPDQKQTDQKMAKKSAKTSAPSSEPQFGLFEELATEASAKGVEVAAKLPIYNDQSLEDIRQEIGHCCGLCPAAINPVFGEGNPQAAIMFIGEAPGADEDATGRPFVGAAGKLLDKIIEAMGMRREDVYITNIVRCRPPENRKPTPEEMMACESFVFREIQFIKPKVIVTLGATPLFSLLRIKEGITKIRGHFYDYQGIAVMPTFHPAYLLRVPTHKREVWEDMKQVLAKLEEFAGQ
jgi:uracil-DNA glycosylase